MEQNPAIDGQIRRLFRIHVELCFYEEWELLMWLPWFDSWLVELPERAESLEQRRRYLFWLRMGMYGNGEDLARGSWW